MNGAHSPDPKSIPRLGVRDVRPAAQAECRWPTAAESAMVRNRNRLGRNEAEDKKVDKLDQDCADTYAKIGSGRMSLIDFISWVADHRADARWGRQRVSSTASRLGSGSA